MLITPGYAAIFALLFLALSARVILLRRSRQIALGDGGQALLRRAMRVHANFAEYVPFSLLLIYFLELQTTVSLWIHLLCGGLLVGRLLHAYGLSQVKEPLAYRVTGMALTLAVLSGSALAILVRYVFESTGTSL